MGISKTIRSKRNQRKIKKLDTKFKNLKFSKITIHPIYSLISPLLVNPDDLIINQKSVDEEIVNFILYQNPIIINQSNDKHVLISGIRTYQILKLFEFIEQRIKCIILNKVSNETCREFIIMDILFNHFLCTKYKCLLPAILKKIEHENKIEKIFYRRIFRENEIKKILKMFSIKEKDYYS